MLGGFRRTTDRSARLTGKRAWLRLRILTMTGGETSRSRLPGLLPPNCWGWSCSGSCSFEETIRDRLRRRHSLPAAIRAHRAVSLLVRAADPRFVHDPRHHVVLLR